MSKRSDLLKELVDADSKAAGAQATPRRRIPSKFQDRRAALQRGGRESRAHASSHSQSVRSAPKRRGSVYARNQFTHVQMNFENCKPAIEEDF